MDKRLATELIKTRKAVKKKYESLKSDIAESKIALEKQFKPLSQPIKELISTIKSEGFQNVPDEIKLETPVSLKRRKSSNIPKRVEPRFLAAEVVAEHLPATDVAPHNEEMYEEAYQEGYDERLDQSVRQAKQTIQQMMRPEILESYLESFSGLSKYYVEELIRDTEDKFDFKYGVRFDLEEDKFAIGNKELHFDSDDMYIMDGGHKITYEGTPGFYELMFKKEPGRYTSQDRKNYIDIVTRSAANRRNYDPTDQISGNAGKKYTKIIKAVKPSATSSKATRQGKGLISLNNKQIEFVPWKNPNTLVDRLQILVASQMAGHTGHNNEIIRIINELKRAKIIK